MPLNETAPRRLQDGREEAGSINPAMMTRLIIGDCLEKMAEIPDGSVDMIAADLPYGATACKWDTVIPFEPLWLHYKRIIKPRGAIVLTASQPFTSALVMSNPKWFRHEWIWEKQKGANFPQANRHPLKVHENVLVFADGTQPYFPQKSDVERSEYRKPGPRRVARGFSGVQRAGSSVANILKGGIYNGRFPRTIQRFVNESMNRGSLHPTQKPVALFEYLIRTYTNECETVMDNTMGSGTTGVACINTGRNFIGIEKDPEYFRIASKRIAAAERNKPSELFQSV